MTTQSFAIARQSFHVWLNCLLAVIYRDVVTRFSRSGGLLGMIFEPLAVLAMAVGFHFMLGPVRSPFGTSAVLFYTIGVFYYFSFMWVSMLGKDFTMTALPFPRVLDLDILIGSVIVQAAIMLVIMVIVAVILELFGIHALPFDPLGALMVFFLGTLFGLGVALINSVIVPIFPPWRLVFQMFVRAGMLMSGTFFVPDLLPPHIRYWMSWMPLMHGVSWFRSTILPNYPMLSTDKWFFLMSILVSLSVGFALERATRRRRAHR